MKDIEEIEEMGVIEELVKMTKSTTEYKVLIKVMALLEKAENLEKAKEAIAEWLIAKAK